MGQLPGPGKVTLPDPWRKWPFSMGLGPVLPGRASVRHGPPQRTAKTKTKTAANRSGPTLVRCEFPHLGCRDCHITGSQSVPPGGRHKGCHSATVAPSSKPSALPRALPARSAGEARLLGTHRDGAIHTRESPHTCLRILHVCSTICTTCM